MSGGLEFVGYYPGLIAAVTGLHARYYNEHWGFDLSFESQVGAELSGFMSGLVPGRDFFSAVRSGVALAGFVAVDGSLSAGQGARLRWFIVEPGFQGRGLGRRLLDQALDFCRRAGHGRVFLWTFKGLDAARRLYESRGFCLSEENPVSQWGAAILEQRFDLVLPGVGR
ncbi:MAG: GNAT family N-acetyltransferase [Desulfovibrionaceae bacterium]|nr:GNAT family N-acetyltransferase [Desulfovibrionaceae bacterium]